MFSITYEEKTHLRWSSEYVFESFDDAKKHLKDTGFIEQNRLFIRDKYAWSMDLKAYLASLKVYKP